MKCSYYFGPEGVLPSIFFLFFLQGVVGDYHMKYLGTLGFIFIYIDTPKSPAQQSTYSTWIALPKPPVAEKSVWTRGSRIVLLGYIVG